MSASDPNESAPASPRREPTGREALAIGLVCFVAQQVVGGVLSFWAPVTVALLVATVLGVFVPLAVWRRTRLRGANLGQFLPWHRLDRRAAIATAVLAAAAIAPTYAIGVAWQKVAPPLPHELELYRQFVPRDAASFLAGLAGLVVVGPLGEELVFRGLLLRALARWMPASGAILASAVAFGAAHVSAWLFVPTFVLGLLVGVASWRTGSLVAAWIVHAVFNGVAFAELARSGDPTGQAIEQWSVRPWVLGVSILIAAGALRGLRRPQEAHRDLVRGSDPVVARDEGESSDARQEGA